MNVEQVSIRLAAAVGGAEVCARVSKPSRIQFSVRLPWLATIQYRIFRDAESR